MPANLEWIKLYRAVLKESDPQKRLAQIEEAERVMKQALRIAVEREIPTSGTAYLRPCTTWRQFGGASD